MECDPLCIIYDIIIPHAVIESLHNGIFSIYFYLYLFSKGQNRKETEGGEMKWNGRAGKEMEGKEMEGKGSKWKGKKWKEIKMEGK